MNKQWCADERGSVLPLVGLLMVGAVAAMYVLAMVTADLGDASRAQTAADAAALAGVVHGEAAARSAARANGADVVSVQENGTLGKAVAVVSGGELGDLPGDMTVTTKVGRHSAKARAQTKAGGASKLAE